MQTILLAIIAGLLIINMIDMRYIKFEHESYIKRILTVLYWGIFAGALVFVVAYLLNLIIINFN